jgi:hypothetical protein
MHLATSNPRKQPLGAPHAQDHDRRVYDDDDDDDDDQETILRPNLAIRENASNKASHTRGMMFARDVEHQNNDDRHDDRRDDQNAQSPEPRAGRHGEKADRTCYSLRCRG